MYTHGSYHSFMRRRANLAPAWGRTFDWLPEFQTSGRIERIQEDLSSRRIIPDLGQDFGFFHRVHVDMAHRLDRIVVRSRHIKKHNNRIHGTSLYAIARTTIRDVAEKMKNNLTIEIEITFLPGSRPQLPTGSGYAPHLVVDGDPTWLGVRLLDFPSDAQIGRPCRVAAECLYADKVDYTRLVEGSMIEVHEGPKVVATGRVLKAT
jgi:hypothetical protein